MTDQTPVFEPLSGTTRKPRAKKQPKPTEPTVAELVAGIEELPWNPVSDEISSAFNKLLRALKGEG